MLLLRSTGSKSCSRAGSTDSGRSAYTRSVAIPIVLAVVGILRVSLLLVVRLLSRVIPACMADGTAVRVIPAAAGIVPIRIIRLLVHGIRPCGPTCTVVARLFVRAIVLVFERHGRWCGPRFKEGRTVCGAAITGAAPEGVGYEKGNEGEACDCADNDAYQLYACQLCSFFITKQPILLDVTGEPC